MAGPQTVYLFVPNLIGYVRIISGLAAFAFALSDYKMFCVLYFISYFLDCMDGYAARALGQSSRFGQVLDMVTDRSATAGLLLVLSHIYREYLLVFVFFLGLDISSHYCQMFSTLVSGGASHKKIDEKENWLLKIYYHNNKVLFFLCFANETFLMALYLLHYLPSVPAIRIAAWVFGPFFLLKQYISVLQWMSAAGKLAALDWADHSAKKKSSR